MYNTYVYVPMYPFRKHGGLLLADHRNPVQPVDQIEELCHGLDMASGDMSCGVDVTWWPLRFLSSPEDWDLPSVSPASYMIAKHDTRSCFGADFGLCAQVYMQLLPWRLEQRLTFRSIATQTMVQARRSSPGLCGQLLAPGLGMSLLLSFLSLWGKSPFGLGEKGQTKRRSEAKSRGFQRIFRQTHSLHMIPNRTSQDRSPPNWG